MAALVLKKLPDDLHRRLKEEAQRNRRSMSQEAVVALERGLGFVPLVRLPKPIQPLKKVTAQMIAAGIREGRR